ncbi:exo-beta-1,3-glucanase [Histoplasma capsulatum H143]|uniref:Exo-beta-1,3-glucanase n=1 Tax=Ajellomyces capsulatus (strain H143) TaxID=544712 RepID=C6HNN5_AJECH|nr:exo-beta-1,3-glucanase [Histoplasma capsulatum H143]
MMLSSSVLWVVTHLWLLLGGLTSLANAIPMPQGNPTPQASGFWVGSIDRRGSPAFRTASGEYQVYRNVKEFGAKGDGTTDDTEAINKAISTGNRCGLGCDSSTVTPAIVYFPAGTYVVSKPIIQYYYTQLVGDALNLPVIKAASSFQGIAVIDADPYTDEGNNWYTNQNNFFRSVRNFVIDLTGMDRGSGAGIHWQVAQASSLQNIRFEMVQGGGEANRQQGIFMDNGSGGFMTDLVFNGGNYGAFLGNQQFTTRNLTFTNCNTAVFMNWNWAWTFKSVTVNNCGVGLNMSNGGFNQTVGSVLILDSKFIGTPKGVVTSYNGKSVPETGGTLILDNVDFTGSDVAVAHLDGSVVLKGGSVVSSWAQGNAFTSGSYATIQNSKREPEPRVKGPVPVYTVERIIKRDSCKARYPPPPQPSPISPAPTPSPLPPPFTGKYPTPSQDKPEGTESKSPTVSPSSVSSSVPPSPTPSPTETSPVACPTAPPKKARISSRISSPAKPAVLLDPSGKVFERTKPQYEGIPKGSFISVKGAGAKGDGVTDDTKAIQAALDSAQAGQIVYFDHGAYVITSTIKVPKEIKITGEIWPLLMASGPAFSDESKPIPMLQVGQKGDKGNVEISDLVLETKGPAPGAILVEWNVAETTQGSVGMWDVHMRIGGSAGTELQSDHCAKTPKSKTVPDPKCVGAFMLMHITEKASGYFENNWLWVSDHELDLADHGQINIYNGRGLLIESTGPVWLYGSASEHSQLYQYSIVGAKNVFMALIQVETPYYQANPNALVPFKPNSDFHDPDYSHCKTDACRKAWGLRILDSTDVFIYGGGLYSFFENYSQECLATESCQENMIEVDCSPVHLFGISTKASTNMITRTNGGQGLVKQIDNRNNFCSTLAVFEQASE